MTENNTQPSAKYRNPGGSGGCYGMKTTYDGNTERSQLSSCFDFDSCSHLAGSLTYSAGNRLSDL